MFNENNHNEIASESGIILFLLEKDEGEHINFGIDFGRKPCFHKTHFLGCDFRGLPSGKLT